MENIAISKLDPETEFLASKQETGNEWELFKENVRPLKRGRDVRLLNDSLRSQTDNQLKKLLVQKRRSSNLFLYIFIFIYLIFYFLFLLIDFSCIVFWCFFPHFMLILIGRRELIEAIDKYEGDDPLDPWIQWVALSSLAPNPLAS